MKLISFIKYNHKHYEVAEPTGRQEIKKLAEKLQPIEAEILNEEKGIIDIMPSGNIFIDSFTNELSDKISKLVYGR